MTTDTHARIAEREYQLRGLLPDFVEATIVRELCGPWWLRWLWWLNVLLVRHQVRVLVEARAQAAKRLQARTLAEPKPSLSKAEKEFLVRKVMEGASDEAILADLQVTGTLAAVTQRGLDYTRKALRKPEGPFTGIDLSLLAAVPGGFTTGDGLRDAAQVLNAIPPRPLPEDYPNVYPVDRA